MIPTTERIHQVLARIETLLVEKNAAYGDSALNPVRIFSKAAPSEQLKVRLDDKLSRIARGRGVDDTEDVLLDLVGYLVLLLVARDIARETGR